DTIIGMGLADRLVGRARSDTQQVLADVPVVTEGGIGLNVEAIVNLHPDLIVTNTTIGTDKIYRQLAAAGVTVVHFKHIPSLDGISTVIDKVGDVLGMPSAAEKLAAHTEQRLAETMAKIAALKAETPREPRGIVLYVRGKGGLFFIFGPGYGASD